MNAYDRIKSLCDLHGIAVTALERELGWGRGVIGKMRTAKKSPSIDKLQEVADFFDVTVEYFMDEETEKNTMTLKESKLMKEFRDLSEANQAIVMKMISGMLDLQKGDEPPTPDNKKDKN